MLHHTAPVSSRREGQLGDADMHYGSYHLNGMTTAEQAVSFV